LDVVISAQREFIDGPHYVRIRRLRADILSLSRIDRKKAIRTFPLSLCAALKAYEPSNLFRAQIIQELRIINVGMIGSQALETVGNSNCCGISSVVKLVAKGFLIKHPLFFSRGK
jgi:hypothetical protein